MVLPHKYHTELFIKRLVEFGGRCGYTFEPDPLHRVKLSSLEPGAKWICDHEPKPYDDSRLEWSNMLEELDRAIATRWEDVFNCEKRLPQSDHEAAEAIDSKGKHVHFINRLMNVQVHLGLAEARFPHHYSSDYQSTLHGVKKTMLPMSNEIQRADSSPHDSQRDEGDPSGQPTCYSLSPVEDPGKLSHVLTHKSSSDERTPSTKESSTSLRLCPPRTVKDSSGERTPSPGKSSIGFRERVRRWSHALTSKGSSEERTPWPQSPGHVDGTGLGSVLANVEDNSPAMPEPPGEGGTVPDIAEEMTRAAKKKSSNRKKWTREREQRARRRQADAEQATVTGTEPEGAPRLDENDHLQAQKVGLVTRCIDAVHRLTTYILE